MKPLTLTATQLSNILQVPLYRVRYLAKMLKFTKYAQKPITYIFMPDHPMYKSMQLVRLNPNAKPIYSVADLSTIWTWHDKPYSKSAIRKRLNNKDIPIYNKEKKGFVYLSDLQQVRQEP